MIRPFRIGVSICAVSAIAALQSPSPRAQPPGCAPGARPLDGSCNAPLDHGKAGSTFLRLDGYEAASPSAPPARELSNLFLAQEPFPGLTAFETVLIPFDALQRGQHPMKQGDFRLNQLAVAFGQALVHDLTKAHTGFSPAALSAPDFQYAPTDPLCQKLAEVTPTTIYYFSCTAASSSDGTNTTVSIDAAGRYTLVAGTTWSYHAGPFSVTVPNARFTNRKSTFPLAASLAPDDGGVTQVPVNDVTSFLDLSIIYGNSTAVNALLRANDGSGKLRVAADGDIPFGGPGLANDCGAFDPVNNPSSASGDSRVDENLFLDAVHSLLFRGHNRDADWVATNHPELTTDEERFQRARAINIARFQQQVYNELLPAIFGTDAVWRYLGPYRGHDASIDPRIASTFDLAFRVAHGQVALPPFILDDSGAPVLIEGTLGFPSHSRPNCLFTTFRQIGGAAVARSAMLQSAQEVTGEVSDLMRNIVFRTANGQNTAGFNLDIEQLNIIRGREFATPNFNALRTFWRGQSVYDLPACSRAPEAGVDPIKCFKYVTKNGETADRLQETYRHVDRIDAFIGLMLEDTANNGHIRFPQTATAIVLGQMKRTRAADPWFYQNTANSLHFTRAELARINETVAQSLAASYGIRGIADAFEVTKRRRRSNH